MQTEPSPVHELDVVALTEDVPEHNLRRGQMGTALDELAPGIFDVEFSDNQGRTVALVTLRTNQIMTLHKAGAAPAP